MAMVRYSSVAAPAQPRVSVCIANFNGERLLVDCMESVLAQDSSGAIEIIVHDDASTDGSIALLRRRYPQVELLASDANVGFCISNNRMVECARGEYVLLLNNDAALFPGAIATLLVAAREQSKAAILTLPQYDWETGALVDHGCLLDPFYNPLPNRDPGQREVAYVIGACLWIPRKLWHELGGFPDWIESIGEDLYLCCLARLRLVSVQAIDGSGYRHRQGASFGGNRVDAGRLVSTYRRRFLSERNKTALMIVLTPSVVFLPLLLVHMLLLTLEGVALSLFRRDAHIWTRIYLPALAFPLRNARRLAERRRIVQSSRSVNAEAYFRPMRWFPHKLRLLFRHGMPTIN